MVHTVPSPAAGTASLSINHVPGLGVEVSVTTFNVKHATVQYDMSTALALNLWLNAAILLKKRKELERTMTHHESRVKGSISWGTTAI